MLNVGKIEEGFVLDHIKAGKSLSIYEHLQLDKEEHLKEQEKLLKKSLDLEKHFQMLEQLGKKLEQKKRKHHF